MPALPAAAALAAYAASTAAEFTILGLSIQMTASIVAMIASTSMSFLTPNDLPARPPRWVQETRHVVEAHP